MGLTNGYHYAIILPMTHTNTIKAAIFTIIAMVAFSSTVAMPQKEAAADTTTTISTTI